MNKKLFSILSILISISILLSACSASAPAANSGEAVSDDALSGTVSISGAFALYPMMTVWADEFSKIHPGVQFDIQGGGAGKGMTDTIAGAVDIGMISRSIKPEEEAEGIFWVSVTKDAVFPIISKENPAAEQLLSKGISQEIYNRLYITGEITTWGELVGDLSITDVINVYTRSDAAGAAEQWARYAGGSAQEDLKGIGINSEPSMVDTVIKDPLGIGYGNLNSVYDMSTGNPVEGIVIPPIDINGNGQADPDEVYSTKEDAFNAVANGAYPSPPARFENLATKGKPEGITLTFIEWILTDGQQYLEEAGFVPLTSEQQAESLARLK